jgi:ribonuclease J
MDGLELKFLGGLGEIGMNCMALRGPEGTVLIDCGIAFPRGTMLCPDYILPDLDHLEKMGSEIKALVITHGHEDHIGAIPYLLMRLNIPVYAPPFALELIKDKFSEWGLTHSQVKPIHPRQLMTLAGFDFEFIRVTHSIPDALGLIIRTSEGIILHTGDFRIDEDPISGEPIQMEAFQRAGDEGVLLMLSDSTNVEVPGASKPELDVKNGLSDLITDWEGRVIVTMFASNVYRMGTLWDIAKASGRRLCLVGRSLYNYVKAARRAGLAPFMLEACIDPSMIEHFSDDELLIVSTGSQGEPRSALAKLAAGTHRDLAIKEGDLVIFSSRVIPGNDLEISRLTNGLARQGATVVTSKTHMVHTSGHAQREELARVLRLVKPKFFIPAHGEYRFLLSHGELAMNLLDTTSLVLENGASAAIKDGQVWKSHTSTMEPTYVEGSMVGHDDDLLLKERKRLLFNGAIFCAVTMDHRGKIHKLDVHTLGIPDLHEDMLDNLHEVAKNYINANRDSRLAKNFQEELQFALRREVRRNTNQKPSVIATIHFTKV